MNAIISPYSDICCLVLTPLKGVITMRDQRKIGCIFVSHRCRYVALHKARKGLDEEIARLKTLKLSKPIRVTIVTDAQWGSRGRLPETIAGTGIHATKKQLKESFIIGEAPMTRTFWVTFKIDGRLAVQVDATSAEEAFKKAWGEYETADLLDMEVVDSEIVNCFDEDAQTLTDYNG